jgi:hypothetical protein
VKAQLWRVLTLRGPRGRKKLIFGTFTIRRKFTQLWNTTCAKRPRFVGRERIGRANEGDFWSRESCFASVFQKSKIPSPQPPAPSPQPQSYPHSLCSMLFPPPAPKKLGEFQRNLASSKKHGSFHQAVFSPSKGPSLPTRCSTPSADHRREAGRCFARRRCCAIAQRRSSPKSLARAAGW